MTHLLQKNIHDDLQCHWCGFPIYPGDKVIEKDGNLYCSLNCINMISDNTAATTPLNEN
ncbi:MAG: hypothetical protein ABIA63_07190 [bacterium]